MIAPVYFLNKFTLWTKLQIRVFPIKFCRNSAEFSIKYCKNVVSDLSLQIKVKLR